MVENPGLYVTLYLKCKMDTQQEKREVIPVWPFPNSPKSQPGGP